jgi:hypothetical protein
MPHPRLATALSHLDTHRAALERAVAAVPSAARARRGPPDQWTVAEILEHLARVEEGITALLAGRLAEARLAGLGPERDDADAAPALDPARLLDRTRKLTAGEASQPREGLDADAAWARLVERRAALRALLLDADGLALSTVVTQHPVLGPLDVYGWVAFIAGHEGRHAAQVAEIGHSVER